MGTRKAVQTIRHDPYYDEKRDDTRAGASHFHHGAYGGRVAYAPVATTQPSAELNRRIRQIYVQQQNEERRIHDSILGSTLVIAFAVFMFALLFSLIETSPALASTATAPSAVESVLGLPALAIWVGLAAAAILTHFALRRVR